MALVIRRYLQSGPNDSALTELVSATASTTVIVTGCIDIEINDAVSGVVDTLNQVMADNGYVFDTEAPPTRTELSIKSPDGTTWNIQVSDAGVLTAV